MKKIVIEEDGWVWIDDGEEKGLGDLNVDVEIIDKSSVKEFADKVKDNSFEIIKWAEREIKEYQRLIDILKRK